MKQALYIMCCAAALLAISSCNKRADNVDADFAGDWHAELTNRNGYIDLSIDDNSHARYEEWHDGQRVSLVEGVARVKDDRLLIGPRFHIAIHEWPSYRTSPGHAQAWTMILNRKRYFRDEPEVTDPLNR